MNSSFDQIIINEIKCIHSLLENLNKEIKTIKKDIAIIMPKSNKTEDDLFLLKKPIIFNYVEKEINNMKIDIQNISETFNDKQFLDHINQYRRSYHNLRKGIIMPFNRNI